MSKKQAKEKCCKRAETVKEWHSYFLRSTSKTYITTSLLFRVVRIITHSIAHFQSDHCPPNYSELFETTSSLGLGTPPSYTSKPPSVENSVTDLVETESVATTPTKPTKVKKNRKKNLQPPVTVEVTPPQEPDNTHQSSKPNISDIVWDSKIIIEVVRYFSSFDLRIL